MIRLKLNALVNQRHPAHFGLTLTQVVDVPPTRLRHPMQTPVCQGSIRPLIRSTNQWKSLRNCYAFIAFPSPGFGRDEQQD
jgi:hypothetical protein